MSEAPQENAVRPSWRQTAPRVMLTAVNRLLAFWVVPLLVALVALRYFVPRPSPLHPVSFACLAALAEESPVVLVAALFVVSSAISRYWLGGLLAPPPAPVAGKRAFDLAGVRWALAVATLAVLVLAARTSGVQAYRVLSSSMLPNLGAGALVLVNKTAYGVKLPLVGGPVELPRRGDMVVLRAPERAGEADDVVKRVIGLPGDRITLQQGRPLINGWLVPGCAVGRYPELSSKGGVVGLLVVEFLEDSAYLTLLSPIETPAFESYEVRSGEVFVLGDNRMRSRDSRALNAGKGGGVPVSSITGRAEGLLFGVAEGRWQAVLPFGKDLNLRGIATRELEAGIRACLAKRPQTSSPPRASGADPRELATKASHR